MSKLIARTVSRLHNEEDVIEINSLEGEAKVSSLELETLKVTDNLEVGSVSVSTELEVDESASLGENLQSKIEDLIPEPPTPQTVSLYRHDIVFRYDYPTSPSPRYEFRICLYLSSQTAITSLTALSLFIANGDEIICKGYYYDSILGYNNVLYIYKDSSSTWKIKIQSADFTLIDSVDFMGMTGIVDTVSMILGTI